MFGLIWLPLPMDFSCVHGLSNLIGWVNKVVLLR
jgi:hypothetical protein